MPDGDKGQPAWHPSGDYMVIQVEKAEHPASHWITTNPGVGGYNDLWILAYPSLRAWRIQEIPTDKGHGTLHPHFSHDGTKLSWAEMYQGAVFTDPAQKAGLFLLKVADLIFGEDGAPRLENEQTYQPGDEVLYENHGFTPDDRSLLFTTNMRLDIPVDEADIYTMDLETGEVTQLTTEGYNEHAHYSPDGSKIVWMCSVGAHGEGKNIHHTDFWMILNL